MRQPTQLSLRFFSNDGHPWDVDPVAEQSEARLAHFELPTTHGGSKVPYAIPIACRTLIEAAQGGQLRRLSLTRQFELPFAVRSLLPYWVGIEDWGDNTSDEGFGEDVLNAWFFAARSLRPLLVHVSQWRASASASGRREDRILTRQDVQSLMAVIAFEGLEGMYLATRHRASAVRHYLAWLAESDRLAQRVVDAWNSVVQFGDINARLCRCRKCQDARPAEVRAVRDPYMQWESAPESGSEPERYEDSYRGSDDEEQYSGLEGFFAGGSDSGSNE